MRLFAFVSLCHAQYYSPVDLDRQPVRGYPQLELNEGNVVGVEFDGFDVYRGVPYGSIEKRFTMAVETEFEIVNATASGPTCYQATNFFSNMDFMDTDKSMGDFASEGLVSEDCLTYDLYIPHEKRDNTMGILFFIHGGGFISGDSKMYTGVEHALQTGNAVAIIQYRLGIMGFFNAFDTANNASLGGNYGLGDVALALKVVHGNAAKFGADSSRIIVNGESAGAATTMALLLHQPSVELMAGVVAQSGGSAMNFMSTSTMNYWAAGSPSINELVGMICAQLDSCDATASIMDQVEAMQAVTGPELWAAEFAITQMSTFGPIPFDGEFFTVDVKEEYLSGRVASSVPMILGWNSFEGSLAMDFMDFMLPETATPEDILAFGDNVLKVSDSYAMFNRIFGANFNVPDQYQKVVDEFQEYAQVDELTAEHHKFLVGIFVGDSGMQGLAYMDAIQYSKAGARVYLYGFDFDAAPERLAFRTEYGLSHAGELIYTFGSFRQDKSYRRNWDESLSSFFHGALSDLMHGNEDNLWAPFTMANQSYIEVTNDDEELLLNVKLNPSKARSPRAIEAWRRMAQTSVAAPNIDNFWATLIIFILSNILSILSLFIEFF